MLEKYASLCCEQIIYLLFSRWDIIHGVHLAFWWIIFQSYPCALQSRILIEYCFNVRADNECDSNVHANFS